MRLISRKWAGLSMIVFGVMDILHAFRGYKFPLNTLKGLYQMDVLTVVVLLFHLSLIASGVLLIRGRKEGFYIYYVQFIFRFLLAIFTFGILFDITGVHSPEGVRVITVVCAALEIMRLLLTIRAKPSA